jgi:glutamine cyclotransferase
MTTILRLKNKMKFGLIIFLAIGTMLACNSQKTPKTISFSSPEPGTLVSQGDSVELRLQIPEGNTVDSIVYLVDGEVIGKSQGNTAFYFDTNGQGFGSKLIAARHYQDGQSGESTSNIIIVPSSAPEQYAFSVVNTYPHDVKAYTQGLEYKNGFLYESTGLRGESTLRKVELTTGKVLKKIDLPANLFGEGLTIVGDKIIQLTWEEGIGIVYDLNTFDKLREFNYQASREGWGITFDGERLIKSDGTNRLYFLDKDTYQETGFIEVYNDKGAVDQLNELEFIDGKVYANVYTTDKIVIIDPLSGRVEGEINLIGLLPESHHTQDTDWLNGIAYDKEKDRIFVTGKNWDTLFEIKLLKR